jgi:hypothetical protein
MSILKNMKAILGYHYPTGKWHFVDIMAGPLSAGPDVYKRCQIDKSIYTEFTTANVKAIDESGVEICDNFKFPDVLTLEQSIKNTIAALSKWKI